MNLGILGCGVVGGGVLRMADAMENIHVLKILDKFDRPEFTGRRVDSVEALLADKDIDTVVETMGGVHPAFEFVSAALKAGKNAVTANKALVAACGEALLALARENRVAFRCTAAAGGGIPWLTSVERARRLDRITAVSGIMNGTTNFILSTMTGEGADFDETLKTAQKLGYAEADPSADIDGLDIRRKLVLSMMAAFDALIAEDQIPTMGIRQISAEDISNFKKLGRTCKLMAYGKQSEAGLSAWVEPTLFTETALEAAVPANFNLISYDAMALGRQSFFGQGAGRFPTAANVLGDCLDILSGKTGFYSESIAPAVLTDHGVHSYYIRYDKADPWLRKHTASAGDGYVITDSVPVEEVHEKMRELGGFAAAFAG